MGSRLGPQQGRGWRELVPTPWKPLEFNYGGSRVAGTQDTLAEVHTSPCWKKASSSQSMGDLPQRVVQQQRAALNPLQVIYSAAHCSSKPLVKTHVLRKALVPHETHENTA